MKMVNTRQQQNYFNYISEKKAKKIHLFTSSSPQMTFFFTFIYSLIHSFVVESVQQKKKNE